jgi:hypothetical protein
VQADTIVPSAGNAMAMNRYSYSICNPTKYTDPSGHAYYDKDSAILKVVPTKKTPSTIITVTYGELRKPAVIKIKYTNKIYDRGQTWQPLNADPVELLARTIMNEQGNKLLSEYWPDALGVGWVIRNRHDRWYADPLGVHHKDPGSNRVGFWYKAATSGIMGMESYTLACAAADPISNFSYFGKNLEQAILAYNIAYGIALSVYQSDTANDPTNGALDYADAYRDPNGTEIFWERTHFTSSRTITRENWWCMPGANCGALR